MTRFSLFTHPLQCGLKRALRVGAGLAGGAVALVCSGCLSLPQAPKVDFVETLPTLAPQAVIAVPQAAPITVSGSLFHASRYRPGFEDPRARLVGDKVTIQIVENISASQKSTSTVDRSAKNDAAIAAFPLISAGTLGKATLGASSTNAFSGKGGTESANTFSGSLTATVVQVLPNGHLIVAGDKQIGVNQNVDVLRFSGVVDPQFIQPGNVVSSTQVANARIESRGRGQQDEAQTIGWLSRFFLNVLPF